MSQGLNKTKHRIKSVQSTRKITKAMQLIATAKVKKLLNAYEDYKDYANEYRELMGVLCAHDTQETHYAKENEGNLPTLYIVISSDLGLCGAYNSNIFKFCREMIQEDDYVIPLGTKATNHFRANPRYNNIIDVDGFDLSLDMDKIYKIVDTIKKEFNEKKWKKVTIIYTEYINSISNSPNAVQLLPITMDYRKWENEDYAPPLFDQDPHVLIPQFLPNYLSSIMYAKLLESQLSEQASRRTAMDNANDNADELLDKLTIEYNKARQSAITQEITEVVSGAEC
ncbi:MAG: ATP synthase F1 subunit gamma [Bacilli bacterium]|nr:ATP synthase F1 subunit gamma [Bacilli bacterium]